MRKLFVVLAVLLSVVSVYSQDIVAEGFGRTAKEATINAQSNLALAVFADIESGLSSSVYGDNSGNTKISSSSEVSVEAYAVSLGMEISRPKRDGRNWVVTASIPESSAPVYSQELDTISRNINELMKHIDDIDNATESELRELDRELSRFEASRRTLMILQDGRNLRLPELSVNASVIGVLLNNKEMERLSNLTTETGTLKILQDGGYLTPAEEEELARMEREKAEMLAEIEEYNVARRAAEEQAFQEMIDELDSDSGDYVEKVQKQSLRNKDTSISDAISVIDSNKTAFNSIRAIMSSKLETVFDAMTDSVADYVQEDNARPYSAVQLDANGRPLQSEVNRREEVREEYIENSIRPPYIRQAETSIEDDIKEMARIADTVISNIEELNDKKFTYNSLVDDELSINVTGYDLSRHVFTGDVRIVIGGGTVGFNFIIPYSVVTGNAVPDYMDPEYDVYTESASRWLDMLRRTPSFLNLEASFYIEPYLDSTAYGVFLDTCDVYRADTGKRISHDRIQEFIGNVQGSDVSVNISDFAPVSGKARLMADYFDFEEMVAKAKGRYNIDERFAVYSETAGAPTMFSTEDDGHRSLYGDLVVSNTWGLSANAAFYGKDNEGIGYQLGLGAGVFDEIHFDRVGGKVGGYISFGADVNMLMVAKSNEHNPDPAGGTGIDVRARAGAGLTFALGENNRFFALGANFTGNYIVNWQRYSYGIEGVLTYGNYGNGVGGGVSLFVRYNLVDSPRPIGDFPVAIGIMGTTYF